MTYKYTRIQWLKKWRGVVNIHEAENDLLATKPKVKSKHSADEGRECKNCDGKGFIYTSGHIEPCVLCKPKPKKPKIEIMGFEGLVTSWDLQATNKINEIISYLNSL